MYKIIISLILLLLIVVIFSKKIELFSDNGILDFKNNIKNHRKWINDYVNYNLNKKKALHRYLIIIENRFKQLRNNNLLNFNNKNLFDEADKTDMITILETNILTYSDNMLPIDDEILTNITTNLNKPGITNSVFFNADVNQLYTNQNLSSSRDLVCLHLKNKDYEQVVNVLRNELYKNYIEKNSMSVKPDSLPCVMYNNTDCPTDICDSNGNMCFPKETSVYKNNVNVNDCNVLTSYGNSLCVNTQNANGEQCEWDSNICKNPNEKIQCEDIYDEDTCSTHRGSSSDCIFDNDKCYTKENTVNTKCLNFSATNESTNLPSELILENGMTCTKIDSYKNQEGAITTPVTDSKVSYYIDKRYSTGSSDPLFKFDIKNLDCSLFDNSDYNDRGLEKNPNEKLNINDIHLQQKLCEGIPINNDSNQQDGNKCVFVKSSTYSQDIPKHIDFVITDDTDMTGDSSFRCDALNGEHIKIDISSDIPNQYLKGCSKIKSLIIGNNVTSIGEQAFLNCSALSSVVIGNSVTSISNEAFLNCSALSSVVIGNSVTSIGDKAFKNCRALSSVVIPNSVKSIDFAAFKECTSLISVVIGDSVTSIGANAFRECTSLETVSFKTFIVPTIEANIFHTTDALAKICVVNEVMETYFSTNRDSMGIPSIVTVNKNCPVKDEYPTDHWAFTKCIPKTSSTKISNINNLYPIMPEFNNNYSTCNNQEGWKWDSATSSCVQVSINPNNVSNCNDLNNTICDYRDDCYWHSLNDSNGYCKEIYTDEIEYLIDKIHNKEIEKIAQSAIMDEKLGYLKQTLVGDEFKQALRSSIKGSSTFPDTTINVFNQN